MNELFHYLVQVTSPDPPLRHECARTGDPGVAGAHGLVTEYIGGASITFIRGIFGPNTQRH